MSVCKNCRKPIEDDDNGFCKDEHDSCWYQWLHKSRSMDFMSKWTRLCSLGTVNTSWKSTFPHEPKQWVVGIVYRGSEYGVCDYSFEAAVTLLLAAVEPAG